MDYISKLNEWAQTEHGSNFKSFFTADTRPSQDGTGFITTLFLADRSMSALGSVRSKKKDALASAAEKMYNIVCSKHRHAAPSVVEDCGDDSTEKEQLAIESIEAVVVPVAGVLTDGMVGHTNRDITISNPNTAFHVWDVNGFRALMENTYICVVFTMQVYNPGVVQALTTVFRLQNHKLRTFIYIRDENPDKSHNKFAKEREREPVVYSFDTNLGHEMHTRFGVSSANTMYVCYDTPDLPLHGEKAQVARVADAHPFIHARAEEVFSPHPDGGRAFRAVCDWLLQQ